MCSPCHSPVCLTSKLIRRFSDKPSHLFFYPFTLLCSGSSSRCFSLSASIQLYSWISHLTEHRQGEKKKRKIVERNIRKTLRGLGHRPALSVTWFSLKRFCPANKFMKVQKIRDRALNDKKMKQTCLRLETPTGTFHRLLWVQWMKSKCCHLHIFLVEKREALWGASLN